MTNSSSPYISFLIHPSCKSCLSWETAGEGKRAVLKHCNMSMLKYFLHLVGDSFLMISPDLLFSIVWNSPGFQVGFWWIVATWTKISVIASHRGMEYRCPSEACRPECQSSTNFLVGNGRNYFFFPRAHWVVLPTPVCPHPADLSSILPYGLLLASALPSVFFCFTSESGLLWAQKPSGRHVLYFFLKLAWSIDKGFRSRGGWKEVWEQSAYQL